MNKWLILGIIIVLFLSIYYRRQIERFFNLLLSQYKYFTFEEFDSGAIPNDPDSETYIRNGKRYLTDSAKNNMNKKFMRRLDKARFLTSIYKLKDYPNGVPFIIINGYRTPEYNEDVGGVSDSAHIYGLAVDIDYNNKVEEEAILKSLGEVGFTRFGIRTGNSGSSIHVDMDETKKQFTVWGYEGVPPGYSIKDIYQLV